MSACIVEYLIKNYGIEKLETFWKTGFASFENIYGLPFSKLQKAMHQELRELMPTAPQIDWEALKRCE